MKLPGAHFQVLKTEREREERERERDVYVYIYKHIIHIYINMYA